MMKFRKLRRKKKAARLINIDILPKHRPGPQPGLNGALFAIAEAFCLFLKIQVVRNGKKAGVEDGSKLPK